MNRTTIALNIPRLEGHLPDMRFVVAMGTGALLVSETVYLPDPYVPGRALRRELERRARRHHSFVSGQRGRAATYHRGGAPARDDRAHARGVIQEPPRSGGGCGRAEGDVKDVPADYYRRLRAVEEQHWWQHGMREITAAAPRRAAGAAAPEPARRGLWDGWLPRLGRPLGGRSTGPAASTSAPRRFPSHEMPSPARRSAVAPVARSALRLRARSTSW